MADRKMGPREAQLFALREAKYRRGQSKNAAEPAPKPAAVKTKPARKKPTKKKAKR